MSPIYETKPMSNVEQENFYNAMCRASTELSPEAILHKLKAIEEDMGAHEHNAPRTIDLDLIFYGNELRETLELTVPHPRFRERDFVLQPLVDIAPALQDQVTGKTVSALLAELPED